MTELVKQRYYFLAKIQNRPKNPIEYMAQYLLDHNPDKTAIE